MSFPIVDGLRALGLGDPGPSRAFLNDCVLAPLMCLYFELVSHGDGN